MFQQLKDNTKVELRNLGYRSVRELNVRINSYMGIFHHEGINFGLTIAKDPVLGSNDWYIGVFDYAKQKNYDPKNIKGFMVDDLNRVHCKTEEGIVEFADALIKHINKKENENEKEKEKEILTDNAKERMKNLGYEFTSTEFDENNNKHDFFFNPEIGLNIVVSKDYALGSNDWCILVVDRKNGKLNRVVLDGFEVDSTKRFHCKTEEDIINYLSALVSYYKKDLNKDNIRDNDFKDEENPEDSYNSENTDIVDKPTINENENNTKSEKDFKNLYDKLVESGDIKQISFFNNRIINGSEFVKLSDGSKGIAASVMAYDFERGKNIEIKNADGEHVMFLEESELFDSIGTPGAVICTYENNLYVATYNTEKSYVACYRMGDFERVWKTPMYGSRLQSITVNDNEVIAFDMEDGKIKYFDKNNGNKKYDKEISTEMDNGISHHNLASNKDFLLAGNHKLKLFDKQGKEIAAEDIPNLFYTIKSIDIDSINNIAYIAFNNNIAAFDKNGYKGYFTVPASSIQQLNFDDESGSLMISMSDRDRKGTVNICNSYALQELLSANKQEKIGIEDQQIRFLSDENGFKEQSSHGL